MAEPRVLFVGGTTYDLPLSGGHAKKWGSLAERMEVRVVARHGSVTSSDPRFHLVSPPGGLPGWASRPALARAVLAETRSFRPDVLIAQGPYDILSLLPVLPLMRPRPRLIGEIHGDWRTASRSYGSRARRLLSPVADRAAAVALRRADGIRALSPFTASLAEEATGEAPLACFPTYSDLDAFTHPPLTPLPERPTAAWVGTLQRVKDPESMAAAWKLVAERLPEARLVVVGDGPLRGIMDDLSRDLPGSVTTHRRVPPAELVDLVDGSTLLALPSVSEGLPRVAIEAFARGRPVVGSAAGGIPDIVRSERSGLLVPPGEPAALADALVRVLGDPDLAQRMGRAAAEDGAAFRWPPDRYADAVRDLVDRALSLPER